MFQWLIPKNHKEWVGNIFLVYTFEGKEITAAHVILYEYTKTEKRIAKIIGNYGDKTSLLKEKIKSHRDYLNFVVPWLNGHDIPRNCFRVSTNHYSITNDNIVQLKEVKNEKAQT